MFSIIYNVLLYCNSQTIKKVCIIYNIKLDNRFLFEKFGIVETKFYNNID